MALAAAKADLLGLRIAGLRFATGGWLGAARGDALARLSAMGLPARRDEYWRYTDPTDLTAPDAVSSPPVADEIAAFAGIAALRIVFVDGVFDADQSDNLTLAGIEISRLADLGDHDAPWARDILGRLEAAGQSPVARPLATMTTAFATDGVLIQATGQAAQPVSIIYQQSSDPSDVILHHCIKVEAGAELTLLESGTAAARFTCNLEVDVAEGGRFHHIRAQGGAPTRRAATHVFARLGAGALFKSFTVTANGQLTRNEAVIDLAGDGGVAHVAGAAVGDGAGFHQDDTVFITHQGQGCESRQVFKKVLKNGALGVFQGKILVRRGAQKTDGYQISQALLLDEDSQFLAKPELEIYADDVKCSHGSTSGAIDDGALFYLRSRGVPLKDAQSLLVLAFLAEALGEIADEAIAEDVRLGLEGWLSRHGG